MVGPSYPFKGGIAIYTTRLYRELKARHDVQFISFKRQYPAWLYPGRGDKDTSNADLQEDGAQPLIDSLNPLSWRCAVGRIVDFKPDRVIFPWWIMFWAPQFIYMVACIKYSSRATRVIFICHNVVSHEDSRISRWLTRSTLRWGDGYLVHSRDEKTALERLLGKKNIRRAEHPVFEPSAPVPSREEARQRLDESGNILLFFGFVRPYKGLNVLLQAMPRVLEKIPCKLIVAGEIWGDATAYNSRIQRLGIGDHVRLEDRYIPQRQLADYFAASDLVVLPYVSATGSGVVKLAYSYHRPVIVSDIGSLSDVVEHGRTGYVVEVGNPSALADAIVNHFQHSDTSSMALALSGLLERYGWNQLIEAIETL